VHGNGSILATVGGFIATGVILERKDDGTFLNRTPSGVPQLNGIFVGPGSSDAVAVGNSLSVAVRDASAGPSSTRGRIRKTRRAISTGVGRRGQCIWAVGGDLSALGNGILSYGGLQQVPAGRCNSKVRLDEVDRPPMLGLVSVRRLALAVLAGAALIAAPSGLFPAPATATETARSAWPS
jgi:hypothetical protein